MNAFRLHPTTTEDSASAQGKTPAQDLTLAEAFSFIFSVER